MQTQFYCYPIAPLTDEVAQVKRHLFFTWFFHSLSPLSAEIRTFKTILVNRIIGTLGSRFITIQRVYRFDCIVPLCFIVPLLKGIRKYFWYHFGVCVFEVVDRQLPIGTRALQVEASKVVR